MYKALVEVENLTRSSFEVQLELVHVIEELSDLESSVGKLINALKSLKSELYAEIERIENEHKDINDNFEQNQ